MYDIQVQDIKTSDYILQEFRIVPRIGEQIELQSSDKNPDFDTTSHYRVRDIQVIAGDPNETGHVDAILFVEKIG